MMAAIRILVPHGAIMVSSPCPTGADHGIASSPLAWHVIGSAGMWNGDASGADRWRQRPRCPWNIKMGVNSREERWLARVAPYQRRSETWPSALLLAVSFSRAAKRHQQHRRHHGHDRCGHRRLRTRSHHAFWLRNAAAPTTMATEFHIANRSIWQQRRAVSAPRRCITPPPTLLHQKPIAGHPAPQLRKLEDKPCCQHTRQGPYTGQGLSARHGLLAI